MMTEPFCKTCRFWVEFDEEEAMGDCYRYPPSVFITSDYGDCETGPVPMVSGKHWCGEWQERIHD